MKPWNDPFICYDNPLEHIEQFKDETPFGWEEVHGGQYPVNFFLEYPVSLKCFNQTSHIPVTPN